MVLELNATFQMEIVEEFSGRTKTLPPTQGQKSIKRIKITGKFIYNERDSWKVAD